MPLDALTLIGTRIATAHYQYSRILSQLKTSDSSIVKNFAEGFMHYFPSSCVKIFWKSAFPLLTTNCRNGASYSKMFGWDRNNKDASVKRMIWISSIATDKEPIARSLTNWFSFLYCLHLLIAIGHRLFNVCSPEDRSYEESDTWFQLFRRLFQVHIGLKRQGHFVGFIQKIFRDNLLGHE